MRAFPGIIAAALLSSAATAGPVQAADVGVEGRKLAVVDGGPGGPSKIILVATDSEIDKGAGTDTGSISATIRINRGDIAGGFALPAGAFDGDAGWRKNAGDGAQYLNQESASGVPTGARTLLIKSGRKLRLVAHTLGDDALDFADLAAATDGIEVVVAVHNGDTTHRSCTRFPASEVKVGSPSPSGRTKLIARRGVAVSCPGIELAPTPDLPAPPSAPYLWFDGSDPGALADLAARVSDPDTAPFFASFRGQVDGALASLNSAGDDQRAHVAKAAGLLQVLGETPPGASGYATYADVAVTALLGIGDRTALDSIDEFVTPPANLLTVLHDSGRLQSMCEAYDLLRGAGVASGDDAAIRDLIANWADELVIDWNLTGDPFGVFAGHRDNWAVKAGSALVTAALALPDHTGAPTWLAVGMEHIQESLHEVVMAPGWYSEGPHYVNYSLNNLASTAWHVRNATGEDWFDDLAPLVDTALALRQPDGESAPFEEGVPNAFPHDVLAAAYPSRAARMLWAWQESSGDPVNYDNQQIHSVTRFIVTDIDTAAAAPEVAPTAFLDGDTHAAVLRSAWDADAVQLTFLTALDHSASEQFASRHNTENPLDVTLFAAGAMLLPTASGGPEVTSSANRAIYLQPGSKNIPLVDGNAPYLLDPLAIEFGERLDSTDAGGYAHRLLDSATTRVQEFATGVAVQRTVALVDDGFAVVLDRFEGSAPHSYAATWRGRGDESVRILTAAHAAVDYAWPDSSTPLAHLAVDVAASAPLSGNIVSGLYAPAWGVEENLSPLRIAATATSLHALAVLRPRAEAAAASTIAAVGGGDVTAFAITDGARETVVASRGGAGFSVAGVSGDALLAVVRRDAGVATGMAMVRGTSIVSDGSLETDRLSTISLGIDDGAAVIAISADVEEPLRIELADMPGMDGGAAHHATFDGNPLGGSAFAQSGATFTVRVPHGGTVVIEPQ